MLYNNTNKYIVYTYIQVTHIYVFQRFTVKKKKNEFTLFHIFYIRNMIEKYLK